MKLKLLILPIVLMISGLIGASCSEKKKEIADSGIPAFEKILIDSVFRSESITTADLNNDGEKDIVIGDVWYEAPGWKMHEIRPPGDFLSSVYREDKPASDYAYYSNSFACHVMDVNGDGWQDVLVYPVMGRPVYWYKNPQGKAGHWEEFRAVEDYHGESPILTDLEGKGELGFVTGVKWEEGNYQMSWMSPQRMGEFWKELRIGEGKGESFAPGAVGHGLGVGDIDGDGKKDVLTRQGWYKAPQDETQNSWDFFRIPFDSIASPEYPQYVFAQMPIWDIDEDGDADFFASSAHRYGLWWFEQKMEAGERIFQKHEIPYKLSQAHAVAMGDLNQNGKPDIITGKRYLAHNGNDPGWDDPLVLVFMEAEKQEGGELSWRVEEIDRGVGVGTQIELADMNKDRRTDLLVSNKKGTYLFLQK
ncbi:MAG: VCBS repeat-containing protein [Bacteroidia bacterium]|nr:VCBS repeat-containing protein [Bacteroidia bacterium]